MKKIKFGFVLILSITMFAFTSCDNEPLEGEFDTNSGGSNGGGNTNPSGYAMTYKLNGVFHQVNNVFGNNEDSWTIWAEYPGEEYILLQGGHLTSLLEMDIWINREHLIAGTTYNVSRDTFKVTTHVDFIDNSNNIQEETISGFITITFVDEVNKIVQGVFELCTTDYFSDEVDFEITEGTFNYVYDTI